MNDYQFECFWWAIDRIISWIFGPYSWIHRQATRLYRYYSDKPMRVVYATDEEVRASTKRSLVKNAAIWRELAKY